MNARIPILHYFVVSLLMMVVALYNGFPLVGADTAGYIEQAIYPHFLPDKTPFYGIFIRVSSLHLSLWFTVCLQSLLLGFLLLRYIGFMYRDSKTINGNFNFILVTAVAILSFTCVSWVSSNLMSDVFTPILLLAMLLLLTEKQAGRWMPAIYAGIIFMAIAMHFSHIAIVVIVAISLICYGYTTKQRDLIQRSVAILLICAAFWGVMCGANVVKKHGFVFARGANVYMIAKLNETGILRKYLDENCRNKRLQMCSYTHDLPMSLSGFVTSGVSPLYKMGGWDSSDQEYREIIHDVFTTPRYLGMFVQKSVVSSLKQLTRIQPPEECVAYGKKSETYKKVSDYFPHESREYITAAQQAGALSVAAPNVVYQLFFLLTSLWLILYYKEVFSPQSTFVYGFILVFLIANAFVSSTFASVTDRFQFRIFWILPATNAILIMGFYSRQILSFMNNKTSGDKS